MSSLRGEALYDLQKHLGHASIKTTEIYLGYVPVTRMQKSHQKYHQSPTTAAVSGDTKPPKAR